LSHLAPPHGTHAVRADRLSPSPASSLRNPPGFRAEDVLGLVRRRREFLPVREAARAMSLTVPEVEGLCAEGWLDWRADRRGNLIVEPVVLSRLTGTRPARPARRGRAGWRRRAGGIGARGRAGRARSCPVRERPGVTFIDDLEAELDLQLPEQTMTAAQRDEALAVQGSGALALKLAERDAFARAGPVVRETSAGSIAEG
jgi:hypothetical protein